ncbi:galactose-1-phosphate uridylyltransferase [Cellulomonas sp. PhB143]|uniref:galactose-1-phosphate uridylyltransferase n=1 Tax=Cellulomonas sp. PhB143 TaxID=2485186 RepID=UPI000F499B32|nr:galactose-1-phosphate uridylyltransferase [Cellulomonas sp. PhB143]
MADGRELVYFDDDPRHVSGELGRELRDTRPLGDRFAPVEDEDGTQRPFQGPEMRRDVLTGDWIPLAAHRMNRTFLPAADSCPLCPATPGAAYQDGEVPATDYDVVVFENRFPSLMRVPGAPLPEEVEQSDPLHASAPAAGRCEVVCFSSDHRGSLAALPVGRLRTVIEAWVDRTATLGTEPGIAQVFCFENRGPEIGVTLNHPHGQIYGYPYVTPRTERLLEQARAYRDATGGNLLRDVLASERTSERLVLQGEHWSAYVPYAARWPVEVHLAPHRDVADLTELTAAELDDLAVVYHALLQRLDQFFVDADDAAIPLPYISAWQQAPVTAGRAGTGPSAGGARGAHAAGGPDGDATADGAPLARLHLQVFSVLRAPGRLKYLAGSESGAGAWISDTTPERIAARLRELGPVDLHDAEGTRR